MACLAIHLLSAIVVVALATSVFSIFVVHYWMYESGIIYLTTHPLYLTYFTTFCLFLMLFGLVFLYRYDEKLFLPLEIIFSGLYIAANVLTGFQWLMNPHEFFLELSEPWSKMINTAITSVLQHRLHCCGYKMVHEDISDTCSSSTKVPCMRVLTNVYSHNIRSCGALSLIQACAGLMIASLTILSVRQKREKQHRSDLPLPLAIL